MILVTGPTGNVGRELVKQLVAAGEPTRIIARDPSKVNTFDGKIEVVQADLNNEETLRPALRNVDKVFLVSPGYDIPAQDRAMISAAQQSGVAHFVKLSTLGIEHNIGSAAAHIPGEQILKDSSLVWTILRPSAYMSNVLYWRDAIAAGGNIYEPTGSGKHAYIDPYDVAAVAAKVLGSAGHEGKTYRLTGGTAITTAEEAEILSRIIGKPIRHVQISPEEYREQQIKAGMPAFMVDPYMEFFTTIRTGRLAEVSPTVEQFTGRPPRSFETWARENAALFQ